MTSKMTHIFAFPELIQLPSRFWTQYRGRRLNLSTSEDTRVSSGVRSNVQHITRRDDELGWQQHDSFCCTQHHQTAIGRRARQTGFRRLLRRAKRSHATDLESDTWGYRIWLESGGGKSQDLRHQHKYPSQNLHHRRGCRIACRLANHDASQCGLQRRC